MKRFLKTKLLGDFTWDPSSFEDYDFQAPALFRATDEETQDLLKNTRAHEFVSKAEKTGKGFLSIQLEKDHVLGLFSDSLAFHLESLKNASNETIVIDYGGMNMAKQLHVGHIRSLFIGDCLAKLYEAQGHTVVRQNHVGDIGAQFGFLLQYIKEHNEDVVDNKQLTELYKKARVTYDTDEQFASRSQQTAFLLQRGDKDTVSLWQKLKDVSDQNMEEFFSLFDVSLNNSHTKGESFYLPLCEDILNDLIDKGLACKDPDQSVVAFKDSTSPLVLKKSSGAYLYSLIDVAAIWHREKEYHPQKMVYVVDKRQKLHFEQVFSLAKQANYTNASLIHEGFGTILGKDKKPLKTRSGDSLYLDELIEEGFASYRQSAQGQKNACEEGAEAIASYTVLGALKYYDLHLRPSDNYVFDWEYVLSTTGQSAPYLQNTIVRIDSLSQKLDNSFYPFINTPHTNHQDFLQDLSKVDWESLSLPDSGKDLVTTLAQSVEDIVYSEGGHHIVSTLLNLAKHTHKFYETTRVVGSMQEQDMMTVLTYVGKTQVYGMHLLGVKAFPSLSNRQYMEELEQKPKHKMRSQ